MYLQAVKEWRVVTDYLERIHHSQSEAQQGTSHNPESLVELDESMCSIETGLKGRVTVLYYKWPTFTVKNRL